MFESDYPAHGGRGGGFVFQWLAALYVGSLLCSRRLDSNYQKALYQFTDLIFGTQEPRYLFLEGDDTLHEDFELTTSTQSDLSGSKRLFFQVKTFDGNSIAMTAEPIIHALSNFKQKCARGLISDDDRFVIVTNKEIKDMPAHTRFRPTGLGELSRNKIRNLEDKLRQRNINLSDAEWARCHFWQLPDQNLLEDYVWVLTGINTELAKAAYADISINSTQKGGYLIALDKLCARILERHPKPTANDILLREDPQRTFKRTYMDRNAIPKDDLSGFIKNCCVSQDAAVKRIERSLTFSVTDLHRYFDTALAPYKGYSKNLDAKLSAVSTLLTGFDEYGIALKQFEEDYKRLFDALTGEILTDLAIMNNVRSTDHTALNADYRPLKDKEDVKHHKAIVAEKANSNRTITLLIGRPGIGKTVTALEFAEGHHAGWKLYLNLRGLPIDLDSIIEKLPILPMYWKSPHCFSHLRAKWGRGLILLDGLDEARDLDDDKLLNLLKGLNRLLPYDCLAILTCRWNAIRAYTSEMHGTHGSEIIHKYLKNHVQTVQLRLIENKDPLHWIAKIAKCYDVPYEPIAALSHCLGRRYTPRDINHLIAVIAPTIQGSQGKEQNAELIRLGDFVSLYHYSVITDIRGRLTDPQIERKAIEKGIASIASRYWSEIGSRDHFPMALKDQLIGDEQWVKSVYNLLLRIDEITDTEKVSGERAIIWKLADFSFYAIALALVDEFELARGGEAFGDFLEQVLARYKLYACDVLVFVFYHLSRAATHRERFQEIGIVDESLAQGDAYLATLTKKLLETEAGYGLAAIQILNYVDNRTVLDIDQIRGKGVLEAGGISEDRFIDYIDSLVDSYLLKARSQDRPIFWFFRNFLDQCDFAIANYKGFPLLALDQVGVRLCHELLLENESADLYKEGGLFELLGALPEYLNDSSDGLLKWMLRKIESVGSLDLLADLLARLGQYRINDHRRQVSGAIADAMCENELVTEWMIGNVEHLVFEAPNYYVRKSLINEYVRSRSGVGFSNEVGRVMEALSKGEVEARRNAIFVAHEWYVGRGDEREGALQNLLFNELRGDQDLEIISTILGVFDVKKDRRGREGFGGRKLVQMLDEGGHIDDILKKLREREETMEECGQLVDALLMFRGMIEYIQEVYEFFDERLRERGQCQLPVAHREKLLSTLVQEADDAPRFWRLLDQYANKLGLDSYVSSLRLG